MLNIVAANKDETPSAVDRCLINDCQPRLPSARCAAAQPSAAESTQQSERDREQAEHPNHEQNDFEAALSFAE